MKTHIMNKKFGKACITRNDFEAMRCPIYSTDFTDSQMQELADYVERELRKEYPDVVDSIFKLWQGKREELTDEELERLADEYDEANELFWELMEEYAIGTLGAKYYSEMK